MLNNFLLNMRISKTITRQLRAFCDQFILQIPRKMSYWIMDDFNHIIFKLIDFSLQDSLQFNKINFNGFIVYLISIFIVFHEKIMSFSYRYHINID